MKRLPEPPEFLSKLPFEEQVDRILDTIAERIRESPAVGKAREFEEKLPKLPYIGIPTPLGELHFKRVNPFPSVVPPDIDANRKEAIKASVGMDLASILGLVPGIGNYLGEEMVDAYFNRLKNWLTPRELELFHKYDAINPLDVLATIRALRHAESK